MHRPIVIRHIEIDDPSISFCEILVLHMEHPALHNNTAHIQIQFLHGRNDATEGFSVNGIRCLGILRLCLCCRHALGKRIKCRCTKLLHSIKESLSLQIFTGNHADRNACFKPLLQIIANNGNRLFQFLLSVTLQING